MDKAVRSIVVKISQGCSTADEAFTEILALVPEQELEEAITFLCDELMTCNINPEEVQLLYTLAASYLQVRPIKKTDATHGKPKDKSSPVQVSAKQMPRPVAGSPHSAHAVKGFNHKKIPGLYVPICKSVSGGTSIVWFRRDCRISDNPALFSACETASSVIPVFIWNPEEEGALAAGGATKFWLEQCLASLNIHLQRQFSSQLVLRKTANICKEIMSLVKETNANAVYFSALYEPRIQERDELISKKLRNMKVDVKVHHSYLLYRPDKVQTEGVGLRGIGSVTHFLEACRRNPPTGWIGDELQKPGIIPLPKSWPVSHRLADLELYMPPSRKDGTKIDWAAKMRTFWKFGEVGAHTQMAHFVAHGMANYEKESCRADQCNTAVISPFLHFGEISPRMVLNAAMHADESRSPKFQRKLAWRDLSYWLLYLFPTLDSEPVRPPYKNQRWSRNVVSLKAWQKGNTGFPLVDAAMRQLWSIGWMNNYMRHVVASFLISYLNISWVEGYKWFQDTLVDADVAINAMMWQNGGMSGFDQWNFVMHPVDASLTCDPKGEFVRKWIPVLKDLPDEFIHQPWKCSPSVLRRCGVTLGVNYPERVIVDLHEAREQSLRDVTLVRRNFARGYIDKHTGNDLIPVPANLLLPALGTRSEDDLVESETGVVMIPVITRREFKYRTRNPEAKDNPYSAVLKGYVSRKRDEAVAWANTNDFTASTINEAVLRAERKEETANKTKSRVHNKKKFPAV